MPMVTGRDVAERAGTSNAVVSYVFNNGPRNVTPETRERVLKAAAELNYRPNALARALSFGRTASVGLIVPDIANRFFGELARALEAAAATHGDLLLIGDSSLDIDRERANVAAFLERRVDSMIVVSLSDDPELGAFAEAGIPVVVLHPIPAEQGASSVSIDYREAARVATAHLVGHGYASIALLNGPSDTAGSRQHQEGFTDAIAAASSSIVTTELHSEIARADAARVTLDALSRPDRPRAVYCSTDEQAHGVIFACYQLGLAIPEDVAVTGFDGTQDSAFSAPPLTTVRQPLSEIAARAFALLGRENAGEPPRDEKVDFELVVRRSCGSHEDDAP
jgi:LacI family transcriptional regulator